MPGATDSHGETCPFCMSAVPPGSTGCANCSARKAPAGGRSAIVKALLGIAWFCLALVIVWFFGSVIFAPWDRHGHQRSIITLPGGATMDLSLGIGARLHCAVPVTRHGQTVELTVAEGVSCEEAKGAAALRAQRLLEPDAVYGRAHTVRATHAQERAHATARLIVALVLTAGATMVGLACFLLSVRLCIRLMNPRRRDEWLRPAESQPA